jgi:hypothetical protein
MFAVEYENTKTEIVYRYWKSNDFFTQSCVSDFQ